MPRSIDLCRLAAPFALILVPAAADAACSLSTTGVSFGTYDPFSGSAADATGTVTLSCTASSGAGPYTLMLSPGDGGTFAGRQMSSGSNALAYQLYTDAARTLVWGDGTGGTAVVNGSDSAPANGSSASFTVYGRIPAGLAVAPGSYADTVTVTLSY